MSDDKTTFEVLKRLVEKKNEKRFLTGYDPNASVNANTVALYNASQFKQKLSGEIRLLKTILEEVDRRPQTSTIARMRLGIVMAIHTREQLLEKHQKDISAALELEGDNPDEISSHDKKVLRSRKFDEWKSGIDSKRARKKLILEYDTDNLRFKKYQLGLERHTDWRVHEIVKERKEAVANAGKKVDIYSLSGSAISRLVTHWIERQKELDTHIDNSHGRWSGTELTEDSLGMI